MHAQAWISTFKQTPDALGQAGIQDLFQHSMLSREGT